MTLSPADVEIVRSASLLRDLTQPELEGVVEAASLKTFDDGAFFFMEADSAEKSLCPFGWKSQVGSGDGGWTAGDLGIPGQHCESFANKRDLEKMAADHPNFHGARIFMCRLLYVRF